MPILHFTLPCKISESGHCVRGYCPEIYSISKAQFLLNNYSDYMFRGGE